MNPVSYRKSIWQESHLIQKLQKEKPKIGKCNCLTLRPKLSKRECGVGVYDVYVMDFEPVAVCLLLKKDRRRKTCRIAVITITTTFTVDLNKIFKLFFDC